MFKNFMLASYLLVKSQNKNYYVSFFPAYCVFQDLQSRTRIGLNREQDGLYYLDDGALLSGLAVVSSSDTPMQWHCQLGHLSLQKLKQVLSIESSVSSLESCQLEKQHRTSYPNRVNNRSSFLFKLVHSDV